jgi:hypothetical protein
MDENRRKEYEKLSQKVGKKRADELLSLIKEATVGGKKKW